MGSLRGSTGIGPRATPVESRVRRGTAERATTGMHHGVLRIRHATAGFGKGLGGNEKDGGGVRRQGSFGTFEC